MDSADSESRIEWFNRCCELQNALGQAEKTVKALEAENANLKIELASLLDLIKLPSLYRILSPLERLHVKRIEQVLEGESDG